MPTLNGQPIILAGDPRLVDVKVAGVTVRVHNLAAPLTAYVMRRWHTYVEPLRPGQCWGWSPERTGRASDYISSHCTGFAWDLNSQGAGSQLWGRDTLPATRKQLEAMSAIKKDTGLLWGGPASYGGDYKKPSNWDPMHWDIPPGVNASAWLSATIRRLNLRPDGTVQGTVIRKLAVHSNELVLGATSRSALAVSTALSKLGLLKASAVSETWSARHIAAYAAWQRQCGYRGADADGIPGPVTLSKLGKKFGFEVK